jgi:uncharacterized protein
MVERVARLLIRFRLGVLLGMGLVTAFFVFQIRNVELHQSLEDIIPPRHPHVELEKKMLAYFGGDNLVSIGLSVKKGDIFAVETLGKVYRITQKMRYLDGAVPYRIVSIASRKLRHVSTYRDPKCPQWPTVSNVALGTMVSEILKEKKPDDIARYREAVSNDPALVGSFVSRDLKGTVILMDFVGEENYQYIFDSIKKVVKEEEDRNTTFHLGGRPIMLGYLNLYVGKISYMFGLAILVMVLLLFFSFGNVRGVILPLFSGLLTVAWTLGIIGTFRARMDMLSLTVPFLILSIAVSHAVQIVKRFYERFADSQDTTRAAEEALAGIIPPAFTGILTDSAGFASIMIFPFRIIRSVGLVASLGSLTIVCTTIVCIPLLLSFLPRPSAREVEKEETEGFLGKLLAALAVATLKPRIRLVIIAASLGVMAAGAVGMSNVVIGDTSPGSPFFWRDSVYNRDDAVLNNEFTGTNPCYLLVDSGKQGGIADPLLTRDIDRLEEILRKRPEVAYVTSYVDILKKMYSAWHAVEPGHDALPNDFAAGSELLTEFLGGVEPGVTDAYFDLNMEHANIQVFLRDHKSSSISGVLGATTKFIREKKKSGADIIPAAGIVGLFAAIIDEISKRAVQNMVQISVAIFILCALLFRSLVAAVTLLLPLAVGKLVSFGVMGFGNIGFFLQTIPAIAPGMGIGVDYSIYVLDRLRHELSEHPEDQQTAFIHALTTSGKAVIFTALSVALGVLVLGFSQLRFQAVMGGMLAVVIICNMLAALVLLPALISLWRPRFAYGIKKEY